MTLCLRDTKKQLIDFAPTVALVQVNEQVTVSKKNTVKRFIHPKLPSYRINGFHACTRI